MNTFQHIAAARRIVGSIFDPGPLRIFTWIDGQSRVFRWCGRMEWVGERAARQFYGLRTEFWLIGMEEA